MIVATNVRFDKNEYQDLKMLAMANGRSTASVIREAVRWYTVEKLSVKKRISLSEKMAKIAVAVDVPINQLIKEGRRFE